MIGTTITQHLIEEQRQFPGATGDLTSVINDIVTACKAIAGAMRYGALSNEDLLGVSATENAQGETQKVLDVMANRLFLERTEFGGHVAAMISEEMESIYQLPDHYPKGRYLLLYDPVDGSSGIAENAAIGTIFSIMKRPQGAGGQPRIEEFLQPGSNQVCAGYAIYGPSAMIVMTTGNGVNGFTLDPLVGEYVLTHGNMRIVQDCPRFFANLAHAHLWDAPVRRFVDDCVRGAEGVGGRVFDQRWSACAVTDVHRVMMGGGIYLNPGNSALRAQGMPGRLRLLYEVNPLAFIVEQAGGLVSTGNGRAQEIQPKALHERCPVYMGSSAEVQNLLANYLRAPA